MWQVTAGQQSLQQVLQDVMALKKHQLIQLPVTAYCWYTGFHSWQVLHQQDAR